MNRESTAKSRNVRLQTVLWSNAAFTTTSAIVLIVLAGPLARQAGVPAWVVAGVGVPLVPFALLVALVASRHVIPVLAVRLISLADFAWVLAAVAIMLVPGSLSGAGKTGLALITLVVLVLGMLEWVVSGSSSSQQTTALQRSSVA